MRSFTSRLQSDAVGVNVTPREKLPPVKFNDFGGGYFRGAKGVAVPKNAAADTLDTEITREDKLRRAPGTTRLETMIGKTASQLILHPALDFTSELLVIAGPELGVKREAGLVWYNVGLPLGPKPYHHALYGDDLLLSNSRDKIFVRHPGSNSITPLPGLPLGRTMAVIAGRLFIGGASQSGAFEPMGQFWSGADNFDDVDPLNGSGEELLIADTGFGDSIVANRALGLDMMVVLCRHSIWVGIVTGLPERPLNFQHREAGKGCVWEPTACIVHGGVMYLGDEGVELFNGNESVNVSSAISEILPLDYDNLVGYSASYDPLRRWYYLYTPDATFIFDLRFKRWYKRSLVALGGSIFAEQFPQTTWGEAVGTWEQQTMTWADMSPEESGNADMIFLGYVPGQAYVLETEDYDSTQNFGVDLDSYWLTQTDEAGLESNRAYTTKAARIEWEGAGLVELLINDGKSLGQADLPQADSPTVGQLKCNQTARALAMELRFHDGQPIISSFEMDVLPRSQIRKKDLRRRNMGVFGFEIDTTPYVDVGTVEVVGQLALDDLANDNVDVDDVVTGPAFPVLGETAAAVTVELDEYEAFGTFGFDADGDVVMDDAPTEAFGSLTTFDPSADELSVDDVLSGPAIPITENTTDDITLEVEV